MKSEYRIVERCENFQEVITKRTERKNNADSVKKERTVTMEEVLIPKIKWIDKVCNNKVLDRNRFR